MSTTRALDRKKNIYRSFVKKIQNARCKARQIARAREKERERTYACGSTNAVIPVSVALRGTHMRGYTRVSDDAVIDVAAHQPFLLASTCALSHSVSLFLYILCSLLFHLFFLALSFPHCSISCSRASCHTREQELQPECKRPKARACSCARTAAVLVAILTIPARE